jgi:hypothetical protein
MNVKTPTLVISATDSQKIQSLIKKSGEIFLNFKMPIPQSNEVMIDVNIAKNDNKIYGFLKSFKGYALHFENHIDLNFSFFKEADKADEAAKIQMLVNCVSYENVFDLLGNFNDFCVQKNNFSYACLSSIAKSFDAKDYGHWSECYSRSEKNIEAIKLDMKSSSVNTHSFISINKMLYHGSMKPENVFEAVCGAFITSPDYCLFLNNKYTANTEYHSIRDKSKKHKFLVLFINVVFAVVVLALVGLAMITIFRKIYQRILKERVADMVRESVINYRSLKNNE